MSKLPYMPLFVDDTLAETQHLEPHEFGAYVRLLFCLWRAGGKIPDDDRKLARMTSTTPVRWRKIRAEVISLFVVNGDGTISNKRISQELRNAAARSKAAKTNANKRWAGARKSRKIKGGTDTGAEASHDYGVYDGSADGLLPIPKELSHNNSDGGGDGRRKRKPFVMPREIEAINRTWPGKSGNI